MSYGFQGERMSRTSSDGFNTSSQIYGFTADDSPRKSGGIRISDSGTNRSQFEAGFLPIIPTSPRKQGIRISSNGTNTGSMGSGLTTIEPEIRQKGIKMVGDGPNRSQLESGLTLPEERGKGIRISQNGTNYGHIEQGYVPQEEERKSGGIRMSGNGPNRSHFPSGFVPESSPERRISGAGNAVRAGCLEFGSGGLSHHGEESLMKSKARTSLSGNMSGSLSSEMLGPETPSKKSSSAYAALVTKSAVFSAEEQPIRRLAHPSENGQNTFTSSIFNHERLTEVQLPVKKHAGAATLGHLTSGLEVNEPAPRPLNSIIHAHKMTESQIVLQGK